jgi:hypothetical protein
MRKHKVVLRFPAEAVMTFVVKSDSEEELKSRVNSLVMFADAEGADLIHRFDECTGGDAEVAVIEELKEEN